jgi:uncharacterized protein
MPPVAALMALGAATAGVGAVGGIGGAVLLVPLLVLLGADPADAAPLGLLSVAAGSSAAGARQLGQGLVHHRLGVVMETAASAGAVTGALVASSLSPAVLSRVLAAVALAAGLVGLRRAAVRNLPRPEFVAESAGEWPGTLAGAYRLGVGVVPYAARRTALGWCCMLGAGLVSGVAGVGGGFIKTPVMREVMGIPVKVAAATSTFTVGLTASAGIVVFAMQGRIDLRSGAAVVAGGLLGGVLGASVQDRLGPTQVRHILGALLVVIAAVVVIRG